MGALTRVRQMFKTNLTYTYAKLALLFSPSNTQCLRTCAPTVGAVSRVKEEHALTPAFMTINTFSCLIVLARTFTTILMEVAKWVSL